MPGEWKYTLTGFGEFLEMREVSFADPMPATRLCGVCGLLPNRTFQLQSCGHVFCGSCKTQLLRGKYFCCPFDKKKFVDSDVHSMSLERCDLGQRRIVCSVGPQVCGFSGKLSQLADHLYRCGSGKARCGKCQQPVSRNCAVDHCRRCTGPSRAANADLDATGIGGVAKTEDLERSPRQLMPSKGVDLEAAFSCFTKAVAEKVAALERQLADVQKTITSIQKTAASTAEVVIQGPYRSASKAGVLITTCKFADVYDELDTLNEKNKQLTKSTDAYSLGGYTFVLDCNFTKDEDVVNVAFILFLRQGEWDGYVEWPFKKKVTLIIMHPRNAAKDIRLPVIMDDHGMVKKPNASATQWGRFTDKKPWKDIEVQGYVDRNALYVNVEFEEPNSRH
ncbi:hypothetical protein HPB50_019846 [Hyalomma asiaticum]|uniref:Uncharacterized protein n=1 Tax=Hyalomma asiaticum TaxID=266040 RepID=A0ACB7RLV2_HYAAI|nr:hypothetical protein HPB50_019846 [Hyalomma asiaticum]